MDAEMMETIISSIRYWRLQKGISVRTISPGKLASWLGIPVEELERRVDEMQ